MHVIIHKIVHHPSTHLSMSITFQYFIHRVHLIANVQHSTNQPCPPVICSLLVYVHNKFGCVHRHRMWSSCVSTNIPRTKTCVRKTWIQWTHTRENLVVYTLFLVDGSVYCYNDIEFVLIVGENEPHKKRYTLTGLLESCFIWVFRIWSV